MIITKLEFEKLKDKMMVRPKSVDTIKFNTKIEFSFKENGTLYGLYAVDQTECESFKFEQGNSVMVLVDFLNDDGEKIDTGYIYLNGNNLCDWLETVIPDRNYTTELIVRFGFGAREIMDEDGFIRTVKEAKCIFELNQVL